MWVSLGLFSATPYCSPVLSCLPCHCPQLSIPSDPIFPAHQLRGLLHLLRFPCPQPLRGIHSLQGNVHLLKDLGAGVSSVLGLTCSVCLVTLAPCTHDQVTQLGTQSPCFVTQFLPSPVTQQSFYVHQGEKRPPDFPKSPKQWLVCTSGC